MSAGLVHALRRLTSQKRARRRFSMLTLPLAALLIILVGVMPVRMVQAEQVLELPTSGAPAAASDASPDDVVAYEKSAPKAVAPMPSGLGSIDDYETQDSSPYAANSAGTRGTTHVDHRGQQSALVDEVMVGALVIGVLAMELNSAHHHR